MRPPNTSRSTAHRHKKNQEENVCHCVHHLQANEDYHCTFHLLALDSETNFDCNCEFHGLVNECSTSETSTDYDSSAAFQDLEDHLMEVRTPLLIILFTISYPCPIIALNHRCCFPGLFRKMH